VDTCGWPTTVYSNGCTSTLLHPKAISTAQHCGQPSSIVFGESANNPGQTVSVVGCVGQGSQDAQICELAEEVTGLPVTPVLYGCEVDQYMQVGQPVVIVGFGQTAYGQGGGTKLWGDQVITAVEPGRVIIGNPGDGVSPCPGDSGGPVFVEVADGSWRVFGTVLGGTTGTPCNSAADFQRIDQVVANFEQQRGIDITPCFDGQTGAWDAGPDCGGFFAGDHQGSGTWNDWCAGTPASGYSDECGDPHGEDPDGTDTDTDSETGGGGTDDGSGSDGGDDGSDTGGGTGDDSEGDDGSGDGGDAGTDGTGDGYGDAKEDDSGCGCGVGTRAALPVLLLACLAGLRRRRR
jgi:hypothetical protein